MMVHECEPVNGWSSILSTFGGRLKEERARLSMSQTELAAIGGVGKTTQINYEKDARSPDAAYLSALARAGVDVQYLLTGHRFGTEPAPKQKTHRVDDGSQALTLSEGPGTDYAAVAMYDIEAAAGAGRSFEGEPVQSVLYFHHDELATLGLQPGRVAGVKVRGDSMEGTLDDGDWVLVNLADTDYRREGVFLLLVSGERRIKRVQRLAGGALYLISDNEHYQPEMIRPEEMHDVEILGRCEVRIGRIS
jgi:phage repressor protein C with HTH and peptisase S24 domain